MRTFFVTPSGLTSLVGCNNKTAESQHKQTLGQIRYRYGCAAGGNGYATALHSHAGDASCTIECRMDINDVINGNIAFAEFAKHGLRPLLMQLLDEKERIAKLEGLRQKWQWNRASHLAPLGPAEQAEVLSCVVTVAINCKMGRNRTILYIYIYMYV